LPLPAAGCFFSKKNCLLSSFVSPQTRYVTARIDLFGPATITAYPSGASSLGADPPQGIFVQDPGGGTMTVTIIAGNAGATMSASSLGGATVASQGNTLTLIGIAAQVNAALASLEFFEPAGVSSDFITMNAAEVGEWSGSVGIALQVASTFGPAFAGPPESLALAAWTLDQLPGLVIGDPALSALVAAGQGAEETLQLTLSVASGVLLLPNFSALSGVAATGIGSGEVELTFTGDQLAEVNELLAALEFAGPAGTSGLAYGLRNLSGPLGSSITSGNIALGISGTVGATRTIVTGADTLILGVETVAGGIITVNGITSDLGGIAGGAALLIAPDAAFEMPYNTLNLSGTSTDEGFLAAADLNESGTLIITGSAAIGGVLNLGGAGLIDFAGTLVTAGEAQNEYQTGLSLAAGAVVTGDGVLDAGNFSEAGRIFGPGTILAAGGDTLVIAAAEIAAGAQLQIGAGGVMEIGPVSPLFGVFDASPLTIDAGVSLSFLGESGPDAVAGAFGDNLDQRGGVIVLASPDVFAGTIENFAPGDRLVFPGLTGLTLLSITSQSFVVAGVDSDGNTVAYTIDASYPAGTSPYVYTDLEGASEVGLRPAQNEVFLGAGLAQEGQIFAAASIAQPVQGLDVLLRSWTTQVLTLTLSVGHGVLSEGALAPGASLTLTAASPAALDAALAGLTYTAHGGGSVDSLNLTATSGWLVGLSTVIPIDITAASGTISGFGDAGQIAEFTGFSTQIIQQDGAPGEISVTGNADFADVLNVDGLGGTALRADAGGTALFDGAATAAFGADLTIGDAGGFGYLAIFTDFFSVAGNITIGGVAGAAGSGGEIAIANNMSLTGSLAIGAGAAADFANAGTLAAGAAVIGGSGIFSEAGAGTASLGALSDAGILQLDDQSGLNVTSAVISGTLVLGGTARFSAQIATENGRVIIGQDGRLTTQNFVQSGGTLELDGLLDTGALSGDAVIVMSGGTILAPTIDFAGETVIGAGDIEAPGGLAVLAMGSTSVFATGPLDFGANIQMGGASRIYVEAGASVEFDHAVTGAPVSFAGADAVITVDDFAAFTATIANMAAHDVIDLAGIAPGHVTIANGTVSATDRGGNLIGAFALGLAGGQPAATVTADGNGGALITLGGEMPCFARGTGILTASGYRPVESLVPGDAVICQDGVARRVIWTGHRTLDLRAESRDDPVRFAAGSLGQNMPLIPVRLSPLHAVFLDGVLVPACHLVNGATITREKPGAVTYYHLELERHAVLLADGMPAESYLDHGHRAEFSVQSGRHARKQPACAKLVTGGPRLAKIRRRLHSIALEAGYRLTYDARLRGIAGQRSLLPRLRMKQGRRLATFALPEAAEKLAIVAASASPAETDPDSEDRRQLAVCLAKAPGAIGLGEGWLPRGALDAGHWMAGSAALLLDRHQKTITLDLAAIVRRWRPPERSHFREIY
jgi:hypothetical protein